MDFGPDPGSAARWGGSAGRELWDIEDDAWREATTLFHGFTLGAGIISGPVLLDAAFLQETGSYTESRSADLGEQANLRTRYRRFFISMSYRHGQ